MEFSPRLSDTFAFDQNLKDWNAIRCKKIDGMRILIVDDELIIADYLHVILVNHHHEVVGFAGNLAEAKNEIDLKHPDLVLLDISLSNGDNGIELGEFLQAKKIPFIYISASTDTITMQKALATNPVCYISKPFNGKDVLAALDLFSSLKTKSMSIL